MPRILKQMIFSHIPLLFLTPFWWNYGVDIRASGCFFSLKTAPAAEWYLCPHMPLIHTCTEAKPPCSSCCALCKLSQVTARVLLIHSSKNTPKTFTVSKMISFLWEWHVCRYSIPPNKWKPYEHEAKKSVASFHCTLSTKHPSNLSMGKASSVVVGPVHGLGYCQYRCGPFCRSLNSCQISLLLCPFFPGFCTLHLYFPSQTFLKV